MASRADATAPARRSSDWWRDAADLALVGFVVTFVALPVLTAGAAVAAGSAAVHQRYAEGHWPDLATNARRYWRGILPGVPVTLVGLAVVLLLVLDLWAVRTGTVPGGTRLLIATSIVVAVVLGYTGLTVVEVGRTAGRGWWSAARRAFATTTQRPLVAVATGAVSLLVAFLATMVPITAPILVGYYLLALHTVARRIR